MALSDILFQSGDGQDFIMTNDDPGLNAANDFITESNSSHGALIIIIDPDDTLNVPSDIVFDDAAQMENVSIPNIVLGQPRKVR